ncbi:MAG: tetratricopeptide repeat protein [Nitrospinota bacterium]
MRTVIALSVVFMLGTGSPIVLSAADEPVDCGPATKWKEIARRIESPERLVSYLQKAVVECPGNLLIVGSLGQSLLKQNRPEAAANALRSGLLRSPGLIDSLLSAAEAEVTLKNYQQALGILSVVRAIHPEHPLIRATFKDLNQFRPLFSLWDKQEESILKVFFEGRKAKERLQKNPDDVSAKRTFVTYLLTQARARVESGRAEDAERLIRRAIQLDPENRAAREAMVERFLEGGDYHFRGEQYAEALKRYREAIRWLADSVPAQIRIAQTLQAMPGKQEESLTAYLRARELLKSQSDQFSEQEREEHSLAIEEGFAYVDRRNPVYRKRAAREEVARAQQATTQKSLKEALEAYQRALQWTPNDPRIHDLLADTLRHVENGWKDAIRHYGLAIRYYKESPPADLDPEEIKARIRHAERKRARLEKSHTGTLAYIREKFFLAVQERWLETILFLVVFGSVLLFLWRSKDAGVKD